ncbi:hypothetical protein L596_021232 [Steinernema carpocapsae]|uniref:Uncharacterized protein n=1 Tax=Steinernema carpocapsae TaxID=34508 RepID=A0A4U5MVU3_STECR|nr:hypothetical protein L596_021231 [Steinernema carpocapsae]TKR73997.1 hypothetical protein L596_021232 [Steinernema carpocapsae]
MKHHGRMMKFLAESYNDVTEAIIDSAITERCSSCKRCHKNREQTDSDPDDDDNKSSGHRFTPQRLTSKN